MDTLVPLCSKERSGNVRYQTNPTDYLCSKECRGRHSCIHLIADTNAGYSTDHVQGKWVSLDSDLGLYISSCIHLIADTNAGYSTDHVQGKWVPWTVISLYIRSCIQLITDTNAGYSTGHVQGNNGGPSHCPRIWIILVYGWVPSFPLIPCPVSPRKKGKLFVPVKSSVIYLWSIWLYSG